MKQKKLLALIGSVCLILVLAAMSFMTACPAPPEEVTPTPTPEPTPTPTPPAPPVWQWPEFIAIGTPELGSAQYSNTLAWGSLLEKHTGMAVRVMGMAGTVDRGKLVKAGTTAFATNWPADAKFALEATGGYAAIDAGPYEMRLFWTSNIAYWGFPVRADSPIKTAQDLKGRKIAWYEGSPMFMVTVEALLAFAGLDKTDVTLVPVASYGVNIRGIAERKFDTANVCPSSGITYELAATPGGIRWIPIPTAEEDPDGIARWLSVNPVETFGTCTIGVESAIGYHMVLQPQFYVTRADTDPELIYRMTKWMDENYDGYKDATVAAKTLDINTFKSSVVDKVFIPIHDGVVRYLKEKGMWTAENEARQTKYTALVTRYVEAYEAAIKMAEEKGIVVGPRNEEWVQLWEDYKKELNLPPFTP